MNRLDSLGTRVWDAAVIGAGPAGGLLATCLARLGLRVLLLERRFFPREKVCGGCLNAAALRILEECGLGQLPNQSSGVAVDRLALHAAGRSLEVPLLPGQAILRSQFDTRLAAAAEDAGAEVRFGVTARIVEVESRRGYLEIEVQSAEQQSCTVRSRVGVVAAGLDGARRVAPQLLSSRGPASSRVGVGGVWEGAEHDFREGRVHMHVSRRGYVGAVRLRDGKTLLAAALARDQVRACGDVRTAVAEILTDCGVGDLDTVSLPHLQGTPPLTRSAITPAAERLFVVGDAAGYVEPFTGDGMAAALATARSVVPYVERACEKWDARLIAAWSREYRQLVGARQIWTRGFAALIARPALTRTAVLAAASSPRIARLIACLVSRASTVNTSRRTVQREGQSSLLPVSTRWPTTEPCP